MITVNVPNFQYLLIVVVCKFQSTYIWRICAAFMASVIETLLFLLFLLLLLLVNTFIVFI